MKNFLITLMSLVAIILTSQGGYGREKEVTVLLQSGKKKIFVNIFHPQKVDANSFPAVIIVPGLHSDNDSPWLRKTAVQLAEEGFFVYTFNWAESGIDNNHLEGLKALESILAVIRNDPQIDNDKLILVGKSFGSIITNELFNKDQSIKALIQLNPFCDNQYVNPLSSYIGAHRPVTIIASTNNQYCSINKLYNELPGADNNISIHTIAGDYAFNVAGHNSITNVNNANNYSIIISIVVYWAKIIFPQHFKSAQQVVVPPTIMGL